MVTTFGSWLKQRRKELGVAQEELAGRIGCSETMLWKIESGERHASNQIARLLADYLKIPEDEREAFIAFARSGQAAAASSPIPEKEEAADPHALSSSRSPWRSAYRYLTNLPASLTPLIGREAELTGARDQLLSHKTRLLTMTGAPGIGKTRLALQAAFDLLRHFEDGVFFVDLAPITESQLVLPAITRALGLADEGKDGAPTERLLLNHLRDKRLLLVLDNFEQVLDAAFYLPELMEGSPWLKILATSREALHIKGERRFPVPPLTLPGSGHRQPLHELARYSSVELFVERARMSDRDFALSEQNAGAVARICVHLDGLPLAIELAAGQVGFLSPPELEERLSAGLQVLKATERHLPERQRSLQQALDSSHKLLNEQERALFRRLSVFEGGYTLEAVSAICRSIAGAGDLGEGEPDFDIAEGLRTLLDKSLVTQTQTARGERRLGMLETIHEYARERLYLSGEAAIIRKRHGDYYLSLAQEAADGLNGPNQAVWLDRLEVEHNNMHAALQVLFADERRLREEVGDTEWKQQELERVETGAKLCASLFFFWEVRGFYKEGREWFKMAISKIEALEYRAGSGGSTTALSEPADFAETSNLSPELVSLLGTMFSGAGNFAYDQSDYPEARALHEASLKIRIQLGNKAGISGSLNCLGNVALDEGDYATAKRYYSESLALSRELGNDLRIAVSLNNLGIVECDLGNFAESRSLYEESLTIVERLEDKDQIGRVLNNLGIVTRYQGDYAVASTYLERALSAERALGKKHSSGLTLVNIAYVARDQGAYDEARLCFLEGLAAVWEAGDSGVTAECLDGLASIAGIAGNAERAAQLFGCAEALRESINSPMTAPERRYYEEYVAKARALLDESSWHAAWNRGRTASADDVIEQLLSEDHEAPTGSFAL